MQNLTDLMPAQGEWAHVILSEGLVVLIGVSNLPDKLACQVVHASASHRDAMFFKPASLLLLKSLSCWYGQELILHLLPESRFNWTVDKPVRMCSHGK